MFDVIKLMTSHSLLRCGVVSQTCTCVIKSTTRRDKGNAIRIKRKKVMIVHVEYNMLSKGPVLVC